MTLPYMCCRLALATFLICAAGLTSAYAGTEPVPEGAAIEQARRKLQHDVYPEDYGRTGAQSRRDLARRLLNDTATFTGSSAQLYVLLDEARVLAADAGDTSTTFEAIDALAERFAIDLRAEQLSALLILLESASKQDQEMAVHKGLGTLSGILRTLDSAKAEPLKNALRVPVRKCGDRSLRYRYEALSAQCEECSKAESALISLQEHPDDRETNGIAGRYLCYRMGDAERGLPLLMRGSDEPLAGVAARDCNSPTKSLDRLRLAEAWLGLLEDAEDSEAEFFLARASYWCQAVRNEVRDGLDELKLQDLLRRIAAEQNPEQPESQQRPGVEPAIASAPATRKQPKRSGLPWGEVITEQPDPKIVTDDDIRSAIEESQLPWRVRHTQSGLEMVLVPMGGGRSLYVGVYEVQQTEWDHVMKRRPLGKKRSIPAMDHPWNEVLAFIEEAGEGVRLPTETEWKAACQAGATDQAKLDAIAWYDGNSGNRGHVVGEKAPNAVGLYDMLGNAFEWCDSHIARGGSWRHPAEHCTVTYRQQTRGGETEPPGPGVGFRVVHDAE